MMETEEIIKKFTEFLEGSNDILAKLNEQKTKEKNYLIIEYGQLLTFEINFIESILENPEDTLKAMSIAAIQLNSSLLKSFSIRIKGLPQTKHVNEIRAKDIGKFLMVPGLVKKKSDVKAMVISSRFECPNCGSIIIINQTDEHKFKEPSKCGCGRKSGFKNINNDFVDVFSISVEEPMDVIGAGTKLCQLNVICKDVLTQQKIERKVYQGVHIEVTGVLKKHNVIKSGKETIYIDWFLDANYIKIEDDTFLNLEWTDDEVKKFSEISTSPTWLNDLRHIIFSDVQGYDEECEGIILQMVGGVGVERTTLDIRGNFHILLVGDPGTSKSSMLRIAQKFSPKAQYISGPTASAVGLTAAAVRDEILGGWSLEAGALVLNHNALLCLDELDKMSDEDKLALHDPLESQVVSISKAGINATLKACTSLLAAANPKHGSYSEYDSIYSQIDLVPSLINRFDLIYPIKGSKLTGDDHYAIAQKMLTRKNDKSEKKYTREFIIKYIAFSKTIDPSIPIDIINTLSLKYKHIQKLKKVLLEQGKVSTPITPRNVDILRRLTEAVARSRLHKEVTQEDADIAYKKMVYSLEQLGIDPNSGEAVIESIGKILTKKDLAARILSIIRDATSRNELIHLDTLYSILKNEGVQNTLDIDDTISKLSSKGDVHEPKSGYYKIL